MTTSETTGRLRNVGTATLCTQLFKRGLRNVYIQGTTRLTTPVRWSSCCAA